MIPFLQLSLRNASPTRTRLPSLSNDGKLLLAMIVSVLIILLAATLSFMAGQVLAYLIH